MAPTIIWVIGNLFFSNLISRLLPQNVFSFFISMWMPALSAIIFLKIEKTSVKLGINWRKGSLNSYLIAAGFCTLVALSTVAIGLMTGYLTFLKVPKIGTFNLISTLAIWIIASLGEEIGWRGYLQNHLKGIRHSPLIVGLIWGSWHYHLLLGENNFPLVLLRFTIMTVLVSYVFAALLEYGGSVITCAAFHGFWNFLRLKILFGNPAQGTTGFFQSSNPNLTEMEGLFGLLPIIICSIPFVFYWYQKNRSANVVL